MSPKPFVIKYEVTSILVASAGDDRPGRITRKGAALSSAPPTSERYALFGYINHDFNNCSILLLIGKSSF